MAADAVVIDVEDAAGPGWAAGGGGGGGGGGETPSQLEELPQELALRVASFLEAREIAALSRCSRALRSACGHPVIWQTLLARDFDVSVAAFPGSAEHKSGAEAGGEGNPLQRLAERGAALRQQFGREFERVAAKRRARAEQLREAEAKERMARLDGRRGAYAYTVLVFLVLVLALIFFGVISVAVVRWGSHWVLQGARGVDSGCLPVMVDEVFRKRRGVCLFEMIMLCLLLFCVFLIARVYREVDWAWGTVFVPLWIAVCLFCTAPVCGQWIQPGSDRVSFFAMVCLLGILPLLTFCILLAVYLDKGDLPIEQVFIPLFLVDGFFLAVPLVALLVAAVSATFQLRCVKCSSRDVYSSFQSCLGAYVVFLPAALFEILLVLKIRDIGHRSYGEVFVPLFILESLYALGAIVFALLRR